MRCFNSAKMSRKYTGGPKVMPQNYFPIDFNAFPLLQEAAYCVISI